MTDRHFFVSLVVGVLVAAAPVAACAQQGLTLAEVAAELEAAGVSSQIDDNLIVGDTLGFNFTLDGVGCNTDLRCTDFLFSAYFDTNGAISAKELNDYNAETIAGRSFLDTDGDVAIEHFFVVHDTDDNLVTHNLEIWQFLLPEFSAFIGKKSQAVTS